MSDEVMDLRYSSIGLGIEYNEFKLCLLARLDIYAFGGAIAILYLLVDIRTQPHVVSHFVLIYDRLRFYL